MRAYIPIQEDEGVKATAREMLQQLGTKCCCELATVKQCYADEIPFSDTVWWNKEKSARTVEAFNKEAATCYAYEQKYAEGKAVHGLLKKALNELDTEFCIVITPAIEPEVIAGIATQLEARKNTPGVHIIRQGGKTVAVVFGKRDIRPMQKVLEAAHYDVELLLDYNFNKEESK